VIDFTSIRKSQSKVSQTGTERKHYVGVSAISRLRDAMNRFCTFWSKAALGQTEVQDLHVAIASDKNVLRLEVAIEDTAIVGGSQAPDDLYPVARPPSVPIVGR
jgi:hypothetical protein